MSRRAAAACCAVIACFFAACSSVKSREEARGIKPSPRIKALSFNLLHDSADSPYPWGGRRDAVAGFIQNGGIDIAGTQELRINQIEDLLKRLPGYGFLGAGRDDGNRGGQFDAAIFYRGDRFGVVESGSFWLSETPDWPGRKGWDAASVRMATWAVLEEYSTGKRLFFINTHLDHVGQQARVEGARLILEKIAALSKGLPVILTGDFNAVPENEAIQLILDPANPVALLHSRDIALSAGEKTGTSSSGRLIDYIFVSEEFTVSRYGIPFPEFDGAVLSDHRAVLAELLLE
jgi:endonuclease/exonuclease/phosphatase family metal-dependent hydrolase